jgi:poly(A) polymerase Pap1
VPLSEHEQRLLEQMERALYAEDPKFATALEGTGLRARSRRTVYAASAGFVVGVALLMGVAVTGLWWMGVVGFAVMLTCAAIAFTAWRRAPRIGVADPRTGAPLRRRKTGVVDRMEQRWQRRHDEQRGA